MAEPAAEVIGNVEGKDILISHHLQLGNGNRLSSIFKGKYGSLNVAVRKVCLSDLEEQMNKHKQREMNLRDLKHENVIQLFAYIDRKSYWYFVLELCDASLYDYCMKKYECPMLTQSEVLLQIVKGLRYVHSKALAHRNIHPKNILIKSGVIKLADFGLCKSVSDRGSFSISKSNGNVCYHAPEMLDDSNDEGMSEKRGSIASDTYSAGLVFFFFLTNGVHLFGNQVSIEYNIVNDKKVNWNKFPYDEDYRDLIENMVKHKPEDRIDLGRAEDQLNERIDRERPKGNFWTILIICHKLYPPSFKQPPYMIK